MLVIANIDLYRYEINALVKAFYPADDVRVMVEGDEKVERALRHGDHIFARMDFHKEEMAFYLEAHPDQLYKVEADEEEDFAAVNQASKDTVKHLLYDALRQITDRELPWGDLIGVRPTKLASVRMYPARETHRGPKGRAGARGLAIENVQMDIEEEDGTIQTPMSREETIDWFLTEHRCSLEKAELAVNIAEREEKILQNIHYENGYSLYVGIPFCPTTCLYCSFPSNALHTWRDRVDEYLDALEKEMEADAALMQGQILDTIYIGGGTPTTLEPDQLERLIHAIRRYFPTENIQEFTVEAGRPDSITREKLEVLKREGVTRISVNPQTMKDETLRIIGRHHSVQDVVDAFHLARECGFDNINMDIILGLPGEDAEDVRHTMEEIEKLHPDDLTVHSLAIKRGSRLAEYIEKNGYPVMKNTDETMQIAADAAARMGLSPYYLYRQKQMAGSFENTGYAAEGKAGIYNILIMEEKQSILALGAGSISKIVLGPNTIARSENAKDVATYIEHIDEMIARKQQLFDRTC